MCSCTFPQCLSAPWKVYMYKKMLFPCLQTKTCRLLIVLTTVSKLNFSSVIVLLPIPYILIVWYGNSCYSSLWFAHKILTNGAWHLDWHKSEIDTTDMGFARFITMSTWMYVSMPLYYFLIWRTQRCAFLTPEATICSGSFANPVQNRGIYFTHLLLYLSLFYFCN